MPFTDAEAPKMFTMAVTARASNPVYGLMIPSRTPGAIPNTRYRIPKMSANRARKRIDFRFASRKLNIVSVDGTEISRKTKRRVTGSSLVAFFFFLRVNGAGRRRRTRER